MTNDVKKGPGLCPGSTIADLRRMLDNKEISAAEVIAFYQARIAKFNPELNAIIEQFDDVDQATSYGPLAGIPGLLKDILCQKGKITSAGSKILAKHRAPYDATVVARLKAAGAPILGRTNMDEFAMGASGEFSAYGATKNPWDKRCTPGGSSSGSAAAVAAGLVPWAIGTETGGSVRQPASFCNLVGLYPTYGFNSRFGLIAFGSSLDQPGPLTRTVYDNALISSITAGHDVHDSTSLNEPQRDFTKNLDGKLPTGTVIGVIKEALESDGVDADVKESLQESIRVLLSLGAKIKHIDLPSLKYGIPVYFIVSRAEAASNLARIDGTIQGNRVENKSAIDMYLQTRNQGFGEEVKRRILMGNYVLSASHRNFYQTAVRVRAMIRAEFQEAFKECTALLAPTTSTPAFKLGENLNDPLKMYMADYFTVPNCVAGFPALSVPGGFSHAKLPIGIQFMGNRLSEETLYRIGHAFEQQTLFYQQTPPGFD